jgi:tetraacyldisaccharide 4'-kinase
MPSSLDQFAHAVLSGQSRSLTAKIVRAAAAAIEPGYAALMRTRNGLYDRNLLRSRPLGRPALSVGNLTAGGTGKTPVVQWLADAMRQRGRHPAILLRGYMRAQSVQSDEAVMLQDLLNPPGRPPIQIEPNPNRLAAAAAVLKRSPGTDLFILDDAFQHRRAQRDFDLVLIDATQPFGFNHVHPRGLLREPITGLQRANALLLTRADAVTADDLQAIHQVLRRWSPHVPIYACSHRHVALLSGDGDSLPLDRLGETSFFAFSGIARPDPLHRQLQQWGVHYVGHRWFNDHHPYTEMDVRTLIAEAQSLGAAALVTTGKDWVKLARWRPLWEEIKLPMWRLDLAIRFFENHQERLLEQIEARMKASAESSKMSGELANPKKQTGTIERGRLDSP